MKAVVLGTGWGLMHVDALRRAGVQPLALWSLSREQAESCAWRLGIPLGTNDLSELQALRPDWVSIATPPHTHAALAARLREDGNPFVMCEKPLVGPQASPAALQAFDAARCAVNYAFPFLDQAVALRGALSATGARPLHLQIDTRHDLGPDFVGLRALSELACHPLALGVALFGAPERVAPPGQARASAAEGQVVQDGGDGPVVVRFPRLGLPATIEAQPLPGLDGLQHHWTLHTDRGELRLSGAFCRGRAWRFEVFATGACGAALPPPPAPDANDPWVQANHRAIGLAVRAARGELALETALQQGLIGLQQAWALDCLWNRGPGADGAS